ncbi:helicase-related protein [Paenibacillus sp. RC67]|uniref:helicase-related protein n=1 Tax=Paenibacillus sp. RC67 TaxID=3039392 RepID=UPI0024AD17DC|nr:helicase-related protein [Paenibacillus sp. RC67]
MKAVLYAVISNQGTVWHVSLDMRVDLEFWFGQYADSIRIRILEPAISFGQAVVLRDRLNVEKRPSSKPDMSQVWRRKISEQAAILGISELSAAESTEWALMDCGIEQWYAYQQVPGGAVKIQAEELSRFIERMQGRGLLWDEVKQLLEHYGFDEASSEPLAYVQAGYLYGYLLLDQGIKMQKGHSWLRSKENYQCHRCGGGEQHMIVTDCMFCGQKCPYCEQCLTMGRSRFCSVTVRSALSAALNASERQALTLDEEGGALEKYLTPWGLSEIQAEASGQALRFLKGNELKLLNKSPISSAKFLIWAVTGAGKTEMIFPMIQYTVSRGGRVVVATPRRDVVLELKPRLEKAFAPTPVVTLYGGSEQRWDVAPITIATTHQLLRFERAFDLVIIDELDAFPYHNNPMLQYAADKVCKIDGATILLSATPPAQLQKAAARRQLPHVKVTARYHRHPLPVPTLIAMPALRQQIQKSAISSKITQKITTSIERGAQLFVFVPKIYMVEPLTELLNQTFPEVVTQGTSSKDEHRAQKVMDFRTKQTRILVTTTILERGVTIPKSDVLILDADEPIFDSAALVQMAGRAGRSADDPAGNVYFAAKEKTRAQVEAIRQIKSMNTMARKKDICAIKGRLQVNANKGSVRRIGQWLTHLLETTEGLLSPQTLACTACGNKYSNQKELSLCDACWAAIPWILQVQCSCCGRPESCTDCQRRHEPYFIRNRSAVSYSPLMKEWLAVYKYRGHEKLRELLGTMLLHAYHLHCRSEGEEVVSGLELITYVPVSHERQLERGFNQAQQLANELGKRVGIPVVPILERVRHTDKQSFKTRGDRLGDLQGVFALLPAAREAMQELVAQSNIKLYMVDDVYTTGSTLNECARTIHAELKGVEIYGLSWAR